MQNGNRGDGRCEIALMKVGGLTCGIDTGRMKEIDRMLRITTVHGAPLHIRGVINLRGQIVTVIDLRRKFGLPVSEDEEHRQIVVIHDGNEDIGLMVDRVEEVIVADSRDMEPPPSNVGKVEGHFFENILKMEKDLIAILRTDEITRLEKADSSPVQSYGILNDTEQ